MSNRLKILAHIRESSSHHRLFRPFSRARGRTFAVKSFQFCRSKASSRRSPRRLQSSEMVASQLFFGRPRGRLPSTSHVLQALFTQSSSVFLTTCPSQRSLFLLILSEMSSRPVSFLSSSLDFPSLRFFPHILLSILLSVVLRRRSHSTVIGQVSLPYSIQLRTQESKTFPFIIREGALEVRKGASSWNFFHPLRMRVATAASAPPPPSSISLR